MKKVFFTALIVIALTAVSLPASPASALSNTNDHAWQLNAGLHFMPGLLYNRQWEPGYSGSAISVMLTYHKRGFLLSAGVEGGYGYTGFTVLFPLKGGVRIAGNDHIAFFAAATILPGMIMNRPAPWFLFAADLAAELTWQLTSGFGLTFSAGPRYTLSPGYGDAVAAYELLDIRAGIAAVFGL